MTEKELQDMLKARDMLDAQPVPEISPESLHNIMEAMGYAPRPWVGLTDGVMCDIAIEHGLMSIDWIDFARAIEAKLKEKNA